MSGSNDDGHRGASGRSPEDPPDEPLPRLGPFVLEAPIARGGMGQIWAGRHGRDGLPVAIKVVSGARSTRCAARGPTGFG